MVYKKYKPLTISLICDFSESPESILRFFKNIFKYKVPIYYWIWTMELTKQYNNRIKL